MVTTAQQIDAWRRAPSETEHLEFKEAKNDFDHDDLCRYCVAIANEGGGHLLLGIRNKAPRDVVGTNALRNPIKTAKQLLDKLRFRVEIEEVDHPDGRVVVLTLPGRPRGAAYNLEGAYWMRVGESLVPMTDDRLRRIHAEGVEAAAMPEQVTTADAERTLGVDLINRVTPHVGWPRRAAYAWPYSAPRKIFQPKSLVDAVDRSILPVPADYRVFMPEIRTQKELRKPNGLAWREQQAGDWAVGVGLDGSVAIEWQLWEADPGRDLTWGNKGVALGTTIDLLVGALAFSDRLLLQAAERKPVHWVLALQSVEGRLIAYDGPNAQSWFYPQHLPTCGVQVVEAIGTLPVEVTHEAITSAVYELVAQLDYFFGSPVSRPYVEERLRRALDFLSRG